MTTHPIHRVRAGEASLDGDLTVPGAATGVVLFAHGSGSSRHSPRNRSVASALHQRGLATLLADLLTPGDAAARPAPGRDPRFDIELLAGRLIGLIDWTGHHPETAHLPLGLFGASTGAAAALVAAAARPDEVGAVVSRGGRPDLAGPALAQVTAPTLLLVGERDTAVLDLNEQARQALPAPAEMRIIPGATHLFEEEGALDAVAGEAARWFTTHLHS
nr:alpha/beta family hydrolase [uncultured Actinoplanes sp.]